MAVRLLANEVSDLCLGKPPLRCLYVSATVADAIAALRRSCDGCVSVWSCDHSSKGGADSGDCRCVGKVSIVDIACFLCREENLPSPCTALQSPVEAVIPKVPGLVRHLEPHSSLLEAIELMLEGAQNLVVPIVTRPTPNSRKKLLDKQNSTLHSNRQYCWLTQEDIIRYLLNCIGLFCPTPIHPIDSLNIINTDSILSVQYDDPASSILPLISGAQIAQTAIAIVDADGKLIGEISPFTLNFCDLTLSAAIETLSAGELMAYVDCGGPPEDLVHIVKERLEEKNLGKLSEFFDEEESGNPYSSSFSSSSSCSSDEEFGLGRSGRLGGYYSARMVRRAEAIVCYPWNSLVAVMIQALAHRVSYVWVVEEDGGLAGIVTFESMLKVFHQRLHCSFSSWFLPQSRFAEAKAALHGNSKYGQANDGSARPSPTLSIPFSSPIPPPFHSRSTSLSPITFTLSLSLSPFRRSPDIASSDVVHEAAAAWGLGLGHRGSSGGSGAGARARARWGQRWRRALGVSVASSVGDGGGIGGGGDIWGGGVGRGRRRLSVDGWIWGVCVEGGGRAGESRERERDGS